MKRKKIRLTKKLEFPNIRDEKKLTKKYKYPQLRRVQENYEEYFEGETY
jgi:hypothetical protein